MNRKCLEILCVLLAALVLVACGGKELPEGFDKESVIKNAEETVLLLSEKKYAEVAERFAPVMEEFDASSLAVSIDNKLLELGKFESFSSEKVTGGSSEKAGDFATAILVCIYENGKAKYTISFDKDEQICGLYMK